MMIVQLDEMSAPSEERAQRLYEKNMELERRRQKSAQARLPFDLSVWQQMRENYEAIILEDNGFSEKHNIEYALWQLHYRRIEELRRHFSEALASGGSNASQGGKVPPRPDRITKIKVQFKTFLSEATGFYHDLILKIRAKYGLPLGYFSDDADIHIMEKDEKKSADIKKGLVSCHRCLIYLGDLTRYKGLYGDGDSKAREYAAASSYYMQAASLWPSSGNPHHQLAILASYSGDEFLAVYRYFRSLAVDNPFITARDNLIVAFEKNRQSYSQLIADSKVSMVKESPMRPYGKWKGKGEARAPSRDSKVEVPVDKEKMSDINEMRKIFCIRFVRLNGILFTRTSLETFAEVLAPVSCGFSDLLSSGMEEQLNFGADFAENELFIVRLISILVFTVHDVKREADGQTYVEILKRADLLKHAFTAVFELMGHVLGRCTQLLDPSSSYLLPGVLVFLEWLACYPDVASGSDADDNQASVRSKFWNCCISLLNKICSLSSASLEYDEDETCFHNMSRYEEGETENRLALMEDIELRGFLPLLPAQTILDFSRKQSFGTDGSKAKIARIKRILAAGKALAAVVKVDQKSIYFDSKMKTFTVGAAHQISGDTAYGVDLKEMNGMMIQEAAPEKTLGFGGLQGDVHQYNEGEEEDEVIVFKPVVAEKPSDMPNPNWVSEGPKPIHSASVSNLNSFNGAVSPFENFRQTSVLGAGSQVTASAGIIAASMQQLPAVQSDASKWMVEDATALANSLNGVRFMENGLVTESGIQKPISMAYSAIHTMPFQQLVNATTSGMFFNQTKAREAVLPMKADFVASYGVGPESLGMKVLADIPTSLRRNPVGRPARHPGPPPGFNPVPSKQASESILGSHLMGESTLTDDYTWLDGYQLPLSASPALNPSASVTSRSIPLNSNNNNGFHGAINFPFPGKQVPPLQLQAEKQKGQQLDSQVIDHLKVRQDQQLQLQLISGNQQSSSLPEQYHGQPIWGGRYIV